MTDQHHIVPCCIGRESFEGQFLMTEVLQGAVCKLIAAAFMITGDNALGLNVMFGTSTFEEVIDFLSLPDVRDDHCIRAASGQIELTAVVHQPGIKRSPEFFPVASFASEFNVFPYIFFARCVKAAPPCVVDRFCHVGNVLIQFAAADVAYAKLFAELENFLVKKPAIHSDNDRYIRTILFPDSGYDMPDHLLHGIAMVGVLVAASKDGIDKQAPPIHLQRLESLHSLVGRLDALTAFGIVVVHDHGIDPKFDQGRIYEPQSPYEQFLEHLSEQEYPYPGKGFEKPFDAMGGSHLPEFGFDASGIPRILGKSIKTGQMSAGAVCHETNHLLHEFKYGKTFPALSDRTEELLEKSEDLNVVQVSYEQSQTGPAGEPVAGLLDASNFRFLFAVIFANFAHEVLHLLGTACCMIVFLAINNNTSKLISGEGLFLFRIAQVRYKVISKLMAQHKAPVEMAADDLFAEIEYQGRAGVDFITVHCGITRRNLAVLKDCDRIMGMVSRGGSFMAEWISANGIENPLYSRFDDLLEICRQHDVTLSLGDGLRPGAIHDAEDRAQIAELVTLGELVRRARQAGVQVMIEGPGHVPLHRIADDVRQQKRLCDSAPYYVLGPLPTDIAPGYDHLVGAIGGAVAAAAGVDFLCYVTPAEHLHLPGVQDVHDGVIASRIAAHIGDLEKNLPQADDWDAAMSLARRHFDWETIYNLAIDPSLARKRRSQSEDHNREVCTMCGDLCAMKTFERVAL